MVEDKVLGFSKASNVFLKRHYTNLPKSFFDMSTGLKVDDYLDNFILDNRLTPNFDDVTKAIILNYHPDKNMICPQPVVRVKPRRRLTALDFMSPVHPAIGIFSRNSNQEFFYTLLKWQCVLCIFVFNSKGLWKGIS